MKTLSQQDLNGNKIVNLGNPTSAQDAVTKAYVDAAAPIYVPKTADDDFDPNTAIIANSSSRLVFQLPDTMAVGDVFRLAGLGSGGWQVLCGDGQTIHLGGSISATLGLDSANRYDCVDLVCVVADTTLVVVNAMGSPTASVPPPSYFSLLFDGTNDKAKILDAANLDGMVAGTVEFWFKSSYSAAYQKAIAKGGAYDIGISQDFGGGENLFGEIIGVDNFGNIQSQVSDGTWHEFVSSWNASTNETYYDGTRKSNNASGGTQGTSSDDLLWGWNGSGEFFNGRLAFFRISNVKRYTGGTKTVQSAPHTTDANTIALIQLTEGSGSTAQDESSNNNDLVLDPTNPPAWDADVPF